MQTVEGQIALAKFLAGLLTSLRIMIFGGKGGRLSPSIDR